MADDDCVICLEALAPCAATRTLRCGHTFHRTCIASALAVTAATCPLCRRVVRGVAPAPPAHVPAAMPAVARHRLLQRLDRIDRLITRVTDRLRQMPEPLVRSADIASSVRREVRDIRELLNSTRPPVAAVDPPVVASALTAPARRPRPRAVTNSNNVSVEPAHDREAGPRRTAPVSAVPARRRNRPRLARAATARHA